MSKHNKVNKSNYDQGGRLTPDEMAREQAREIDMSATRRKFSASKQPPEGDAAPAPNQARNEREEEE